MPKENFENWSKSDFVKEITKLRKRKKYGVVWEEKPEQVAELCKEKLPILAVNPNWEIMTDEECPVNILIEGDNYHALSVLSYTHMRQIDLIYIDPPYNTGKKKEWKYNDHYVDKEDLYRHSKWLSFMSKRLSLAKNLLKDDGIILISIDDNEIAQLKLLCDELFGEQNLLAVLVWDLGTGTQAGHFTRSHEYILAYAKRKASLKNFSGGKGEIEHSALKKISYKNPASEFTFPKGTRFDALDGTELKGTWGGSEKTRLLKGRMISRGKKLVEAVTLEAGWAQKLQMEEWFSGKETIDSKGQEVTEFYFNQNGVLRYKKVRSIINPKSVLRDTGSTKTGSDKIRSLFGGETVFEFPKPTELIKYLLEITTRNDSTILDFMAGSGTTGHAVLELNKEDNGKRKFILCTNNEGKICTDILYPRLKKVIKGYTAPNGEKVEPTGGNLKYFKTDFVDAAPTDANKKKLVDKSTEMLCLKEDCFEEVKREQKFRIYANKRGKNLGIIYEDEGIEPFKRAVRDLEREFVVYVFSLDESAREEEFEDMRKLVELKPIPAVILNVYKRIFK